MFKTLVLDSNLEGEKYRQLINACFDLSTYFSLTKRDYHIRNSVYMKFLSDIAPSYIDTILTWNWFAYHLYSPEPLEVCLYHANNEMKNVILRYFDNLYQLENSMNGKSRNVKNLPEDLCFFKGNKLLLGTVSHASICFAYPPTEEITSQFQEIGNWEEDGSFAKDQICIEI